MATRRQYYNDQTALGFDPTVPQQNAGLPGGTAGPSDAPYFPPMDPNWEDHKPFPPGSEPVPDPEPGPAAQPKSYKINGGRDADLNDPNDAWHAFLTTGNFGAPKDAAGAGTLASQFNDWGKANGGWTASVNQGSGDKWDFLQNGALKDHGVDVVSNIGGAGSGLGQYLSQLFPTGGFAQANAGGGAQGAAAPGAAGTAGAGGAAPLDSAALKAALEGLFPNGAFNQDAVNRRTENAGANLRRFAKGRNENNRAALASRGLIGSGPEATAQNKVEEDIGNRYADEVSGIYADESDNADSRMMQALSLAAGLSQADSDRALGYLRAGNDYSLGSQRNSNDFTLGQGNLALGSTRATNDYNLGLGNFGLDRDRLDYDMSHGDTDQMIQLLQQLINGADISGRGHIGNNK